ncbi:protein-glutamine glutaminase family protein, partial [Thermodesulfobacteriota bacterium]
MPKPNAIVDRITGLSPKVPAPAADFMREAPEGVTVEFAGGQTAKLDPKDARSPGYAEILDELRDMEAPVYAEVDPETQAITKVVIPLTTRVWTLKDMESGDLDVALEMSHARHVLKQDNPEFQEISQALKNAQADDLTVIVTETDENEIIDVRMGPNRAGVAEPAGPLAEESRRAPTEVTPAKAKSLFEKAKGKSCDPRGIAEPCIPFVYPKDGCWVRAHEMCRLMMEDGVEPGKVWIYAHSVLEVRTPNDPSCM